MDQTTRSNDRIVAMLFSDIKDYSAIKNDELLTKVAAFIEEFRRQFLNSANHVFYRTWGDALFICSDDPNDLAEIALDLRDKFRNTNWAKLGFQAPLAVRIGLHTEKVRLLFESDQIKDVIGTHVSTTARIEPIVDPNQAFCSDMFRRLLSNDPQSNVKSIPLGQKKLAKNFGQMELYRLVRAYEVTDNQIDTSGFGLPAIPMPRIKKDFSDKEVSDFLAQSFLVIVEYFRQGLQQLEQQGKDIKTDFKPDSSTKLRCVVYVKGQRRAQCYIRLTEEFRSSGIRFSEGQMFDENSYNDTLIAEHNDQTMYVRALMGSMHASQDGGKEKTPEQAAEYLWSRFIRPLAH